MFAILLDRKFPGRGIARTLLITPFLVMPAAAALLWKYLDLQPGIGLMNWALSPFGVANVDWITDTRWRSIVIVLTWQWTPFMMLILLAGLQGQSKEILEAAQVDGAGAWQHLQPDHAAAPAAVSSSSATLLGSIYHRADVRRHLHHHPGRPGRQPRTCRTCIYLTTFRSLRRR